MMVIGKTRQILPALVLLSTSFRTSMSLSMTSASQRPRNIVVIGGGVQGTSVAYHIAKSQSLPPQSKITILESRKLASAASGKGGGFMARSWGDGGPTQQLHHLAFDMYQELSESLNVESYRKIPVLSVQPGKKKIKSKDVPAWLNGNAGRVSVMGAGDDTAQITPNEFVHKMAENVSDKVEVKIGTCIGVQSSESDGEKIVTGVTYRPRLENDSGEEQTQEDVVIECDTVIVSAGPWSCAAEDWFPGSVSLPMEGVKSTSIVWKPPKEQVDATALFCGEDDRFGTHLEVYPRPDGTIYLCGIGGSDYVPKEDLKSGAFREVCEANPTRVSAAVDSFKEMSAVYREEGELDRVQACMRPCPPDAMPYMGPIPGYDGAYINAGHNCWGIAWAPACGKAMSELVLDGKSTSVDLSPFDPSRFTQMAERGNRGRKRQGTDVGEQW